MTCHSFSGQGFGGQVLLAATVALLVAGCAAPVEAEVSSSATRFVAAVSGDPVAACDLVAPATREELLDQTGEDDCPRALAAAHLPAAGQVTSVEVAGQMARVTTSTQTVFLSRFDRGWLVVATGCSAPEGPGRPASEKPDPDLPYDCLVEGS